MSISRLSTCSNSSRTPESQNHILTGVNKAHSGLITFHCAFICKFVLLTSAIIACFTRDLTNRFHRTFHHFSVTSTVITHQLQNSPQLSPKLHCRYMYLYNNQTINKHSITVTDWESPEEHAEFVPHAAAYQRKSTLQVESGQVHPLSLYNWSLNLTRHPLVQ